jgi:hypothetical protein
MKLISFDIGIKNMAYCIFDISGQQISIDGWNVLNLLQEEVVTEICTQIIPGKTKKVIPKPCIKTAKYKKNGQCYCEKHAKMGPFIIPTKKTTTPYLKKLKVDELLKLCASVFFMEIETLPKLKKDMVDKLESYYEKNCLEPIIKKKVKNASDTDLITIGKNMKDALNLTTGIDEVTHVVIENQISPIANRMKTIQGMLAQYFIMKNTDTHIDFVSSANKLSQFTKGCSQKIKTSNDASLENTLHVNPDYKQHKKDGVYYCSLILNNNVYFSNWINALNIKKKDDLADSFLQGLWYLKSRNIITYADDLKIIFV